jgi:protein-tyrosine phosphatase
MKKILMVCLGNICRSPLAEGILQSKVNNTLFFVDSAGTAAYHVGNLPDERSINVARNHGIDITYQKARKFTVKDFDTFDVIYVMDASNYQNVLSIARNQEDIQKVKMILNETYSNKKESVPDPYYGEGDGFEEVYKMLDEACTVIAENVSS